MQKTVCTTVAQIQYDSTSMFNEQDLSPAANVDFMLFYNFLIFFSLINGVTGQSVPLILKVEFIIYVFDIKQPLMLPAILKPY